MGLNLKRDTKSGRSLGTDPLASRNGTFRNYLYGCVPKITLDTFLQFLSSNEGVVLKKKCVEEGRLSVP